MHFGRIRYLVHFLKKLKERVTRTLRYRSPRVSRSFVFLFSACTRRRLLVKQNEHHLIVCDGHAYARDAAGAGARSRAQPRNLRARGQNTPMRAIKSVNVGDTGATFTYPSFALSSHRSTMGPVRHTTTNLIPAAMVR